MFIGFNSLEKVESAAEIKQMHASGSLIRGTNRCAHDSLIRSVPVPNILQIVFECWKGMETEQRMRKLEFSS